MAVVDCGGLCSRFSAVSWKGSHYPSQSRVLQRISLSWRCVKVSCMQAEMVQYPFDGAWVSSEFQFIVSSMAPGRSLDDSSLFRSLPGSSFIGSPSDGAVSVLDILLFFSFLLSLKPKFCFFQVTSSVSQFMRTVNGVAVSCVFAVLLRCLIPVPFEISWFRLVVCLHVLCRS